MSLGSEDLDNALRAIMAAKREELGGPPTPDELLAWRDGRLDPAARRSVEDRLALYPEAARALADLAAFPEVEPAPGAPELSDEEVEVRWLALREKLEGVEKEPSPPSPLPPPHPPLRERGAATHFSGRTPPSPREGAGEVGEGGRGGEGSKLPLAAAALLALGVGWAGGYFAGRSGAPPADTAVNVTIEELTPAEEGGVRAPSPIEIPESSEELVLVLAVPDEGDFPDYEAEILDPDGTRRWFRQGLQPTPLGTFHLAFRREALPPGSWQIHLFGRDGDRRTLLATYDLRLVESSGTN